MQKLKLTQLEIYKLNSALDGMQDVLRQIKQHKLKGQALQDMKTLEASVSQLECFFLGK